MGYLDTAGKLYYEVTAIVTACMRPVQAQARQDPNMERRGGFESYTSLSSYWQLIDAKTGKLSLLKACGPW